MTAAKPHIYLVPGLGADGRLFHRLRWPEGYHTTSIRWIEALPGERFEDYALRLCSQIDQARPFILIGVSQGGILSIEIAKHCTPVKIIIISSIKHKREKPFYFSWGYALKVTPWPPLYSGAIMHLMVRIFFGKMSKNSFRLFQDMLRSISPQFLKWSQMQIAGWHNTQTFPNLVHIHGTRDLVFPTLFIRNYVPVKKGNHYMVVSRAGEVSAIIAHILQGAEGRQERQY